MNQNSIKLLTVVQPDPLTIGLHDRFRVTNCAPVKDSNYFDDLMSSVRKRASIYRQLDAAGALLLPGSLPPLDRASAPTESHVPHHPRVHVKELLTLEGHAFVASAFQRILWRNASQAELTHRVEFLRNGCQDPFEFLMELSASAEGRSCGVILDGVDREKRLRLPGRVSFLRQPWNIFLAVLSLPRLGPRIYGWVIEQRTRIDRLDIGLRSLLGVRGDQDLAEPSDTLRKRIHALEQRIAALERLLEQRT